MLLIDHDKSKSISQDTEPIEQISQPFVNTLPASATINVSPNNLLRDSYDNRGTDLSDQSTDSLVEISDNSDNLFTSLDSTSLSYSLCKLQRKQ